MRTPWGDDPDKRILYNAEAGFGQTPYWKQIGYNPFMSPYMDQVDNRSPRSVRELFAKKQRYESLSEPEKMHARTTGDGYFNNADAMELFAKTVNRAPQGQELQQLYQFGLDSANEKARMFLDAKDGREGWAGAQLGGQTWGSMTSRMGAAGDPRAGRAIYQLGDQNANALMAYAHRGIMPGEDAIQGALWNDYWGSILEPAGGWQAFNMGYKSNFGGGPDAPTAASYDNDTNDAYMWGSGHWGKNTQNNPRPSQMPGNDAYRKPAGSPFSNPVLDQFKGIGGAGGRPFGYRPGGPESRGTNWEPVPNISPVDYDKWRGGGYGGNPWTYTPEDGKQYIQPPQGHDQGGKYMNPDGTMYYPERGDLRPRSRAFNPFRELLIASGDVFTQELPPMETGGNYVVPSRTDAFSRELPPMRNYRDPTYRTPNRLPYYIPINPFAAGQIMGRLS